MSLPVDGGIQSTDHFGFGAMTTMEGIPRSLTPAIGGLQTPPVDMSLSNSNRSASVQSYTLQDNTAATDRQALRAASSSTEDSGLESALKGLQVTSQGLSSGVPSLEPELHINGLIVLNSHEAEGERQDYNPDEDEVDSDDGDAVSENGLELHTGVRGGSGEPSNDSQDTEVEDQTNEDDDEESEPDYEMEGHDDMLGANDNGDEFNSLQPLVDLDRVGCSSECRNEFRQGVDLYEKQLEALEDRLQALTITNSELRTELGKANRQIEILRGSAAKKRTTTTWHEKLCLSITNPSHRDAMPYSKIYKLCCKEENMSTKPENVHPNLRLRAPVANEHQADALDGLLVDNEGSGPNSDPESENPGPELEERSGPKSLFVQSDEQTGVEQLQEKSVLSNLPFERFPANIQANIIKWIYIQEEKLIHCISRLDPYVPPEEPTPTNAERSGLLHRFHFSGKSCNITYAIKPNKHLALLSVCKLWHYLGVHAFYGLNTFAFSSLGEFERFCIGIGAARRERIQHVELLWMGNQYLAHKPVKEGKDGKQLKWVSKRSWSLSWLCQMRRLKSLIIHINESGSDYQRRRNEPSKYIDWMASMTAGQPNFRLTRSLRTLQGLDFIQQLRGMDLIQFYDYELARKNGGRHPIRDWSFYMDIENVTAMPKTGDRAQESRFENLTPVIAGFKIPDEYLEAVKDLYRHSEAFDAKHISPAVIGEDEDEDNDVEMLDIVSPVKRRNATASLAVSGAEQFEGSKNTAATEKNTLTAPEVRYDSPEDGSGSEDEDATPKAIVINARSGSADSNASTITKDGVGNNYDDGISVAGSSAENPIDLDDFKPENMPRLTKLRDERDVKREPSLAASIGPVSSRESERSFNSGTGLFVRSPTMSHGRAQRESTAMTETLRKRGFDESDIRNAIDLTEGEEEPMAMSTGYPNSSQASSSHQMFGRSCHSTFPHVTFNPRTQLSFDGPFPARLTSEDEESPFKRPRRR